MTHPSPAVAPKSGCKGTKFFSTTTPLGVLFLQFNRFFSSLGLCIRLFLTNFARMKTFTHSSLIARSVLALSTLTLVGCGSHYQLTSVSKTQLLIDSKYDTHPDAQAAAFMAPYKHQVDSIMTPVVGVADHYMYAMRPESDLSNLATDILVWAGKLYNEQPDFAVYNMGGLRAAIAKGNVTVGDIVDVAPFENKICFLTLSGEKVLQLFHELAHTHGEGVSHAVKMVINTKGELLSATLNGKDVDPKASYRIATIDYVAAGNDKMTAFQAKTDVNQPEDESNNVRYVIMKYFREKAALGEAVSAHKEGRITIVE